MSTAASLDGSAGSTSAGFGKVVAGPSLDAVSPPDPLSAAVVSAAASIAATAVTAATAAAAADAWLAPVATAAAAAAVATEEMRERPLRRPFTSLATSSVCEPALSIGKLDRVVWDGFH